MHTLTNAECEKLLAECRAHAIPGPEGMKVWEKWLDAKGYQPAVVELPTGELCRESSFSLAFYFMKAAGKITLAGIENSDRFNAQGLEGKAVIQTELCTALRMEEEFGPYRCQVKVTSPVRKAILS